MLEEVVEEVDERGCWKGLWKWMWRGRVVGSGRSLVVEEERLEEDD